MRTCHVNGLLTSSILTLSCGASRGSRMGTAGHTCDSTARLWLRVSQMTLMTMWPVSVSAGPATCSSCTVMPSPVTRSAPSSRSAPRPAFQVSPCSSSKVRDCPRGDPCCCTTPSAQPEGWPSGVSLYKQTYRQALSGACPGAHSSVQVTIVLRHGLLAAELAAFKHAQAWRCIWTRATLPLSWKPSRWPGAN